jgi:hypothetical protein
MSLCCVQHNGLRGIRRDEEEEPDAPTTDTGDDEEPEAEHTKKIEKVLLQSTDLNAFFEQTLTTFRKKGILNDEQKIKDWQRRAVEQFNQGKHSIINRGVGEGKTLIAVLVLQLIKLHDPKNIMLVITLPDFYCSSIVKTFQDAGFKAVWYDSEENSKSQKVTDPYS